MNNCTFLILLCVKLCVLLSLRAGAQTVDRIQVSYQRETSSNNYVFSYDNPAYCDYTVVVRFSQLQNLGCSCSLPYTGSVRPGQGRLFTLKPVPNTQSSFQYSFMYFKGRMLSAAPTDFVYLLPVAAGKKVVAAETQYIGEAIKNERIEGFYALAFRLAAGDTVFAARRGTVSGIRNEVEPSGKELWFARETNFVEIVHSDGTFAKYDKLKKGQLWVKPGDLVEAGQPIGLIGGENFLGGPSLHFSVYYLPKMDYSNFQGSYRFQHIKPLFATGDSPQGTVLANQRTHEAIRPENVLVQELSKRELKRRQKVN